MIRSICSIASVLFIFCSAQAQESWDVAINNGRWTRLYSITFVSDIGIGTRKQVNIPYEDIKNVMFLENEIPSNILDQLSAREIDFQEYLPLSVTKGTKTIQFNPRAKLKVTYLTAPNRFKSVKGYSTGLTQQSILVDSDTINIQDIREIKGYAGQPNSKPILGFGLAVTSIAAFAYAIPITAYFGFPFGIIILAVPVSLLELSMKAFGKKNYGHRSKPPRFTVKTGIDP